MRVLSVNSQKGGVGKTTLALHLALAGRDAGLRTLLIDLDTQGSASLTALRDTAVRHRPGGALHLYSGEPIERLPTPSGFDLLHGHRDLERVDRLELAQVVPLGAHLRTLPYDLAVIDTPPAPVEARHLAPMFWADSVVVPLEANDASRAAIEDTLETIAAVKRSNTALLRFFVINRFRVQDSAQRRSAHELRGIAAVLEPELGLHAAVARALDHGRPVWAFSEAAPAVRSAWRALCRRLIAP